MKKRMYINEINKIALPLILSSITSIIMSLIDQAFVGRISVYAFAGVGLISSCINSLIGVLGAFSIVFNICGAKRKGENDINGLNEDFSVSILLTGIIGSALFLFFNIFCSPVLKIVFGLSGNTLHEAISYLQIYSLSIPLNLFIFIYNGVFKIFRSTGHILKTTIFINIINIVLDYILIFGKFGLPRMGTKGAAIGTVAALFINLIIYIYFSKKYVKFSWHIKSILYMLVDKLKYSIPFLCQEAMEDIFLVIGLNMLVARMGTFELSAYNLIIQIIALIQMPMFGYSTAMISLGSEAFGRKNFSEIKLIRKQINLLLIGWFIILFSIITMNSQRIISFISKDQQVLMLVKSYLPVALIIQVVNYGINVEKSVLQFIGLSKYVLYTTFIVNIAVIIIIWFMALRLSDIYLITGLGYLFTYIILNKKTKRYLSE